MKKNKFVFTVLLLMFVLSGVVANTLCTRIWARVSLAERQGDVTTALQWSQVYSNMGCKK